MSLRRWVRLDSERTAAALAAATKFAVVRWISPNDASDASDDGGARTSNTAVRNSTRVDSNNIPGRNNIRGCNNNLDSNKLVRRKNRS